MGVKQLAKTVVRQLPPIRRLADSREALAALAVTLQDQVSSLNTDLHHTRNEASEKDVVIAEAKQTISALQCDLRNSAALEFDADAIAAAAVGRGRYKSCTWIEEGVFFSDKQVNICCMSSVGNKTPKLFDLDTGAADFSEIEKAKRYYRVANQTNRPPCGSCYLLKEGEWETKSHLTFLAIAGFLHCNLACSYCVTYNFNPKDRGGDVFSVIKQLHAQGALKRDVSRLEWGGGESTPRPGAAARRAAGSRSVAAQPLGRAGVPATPAPAAGRIDSAPMFGPPG